MSEKNEIRYCKKCGCELMSTNKKKLCENCRLEKTEKGKKAGYVIVAAVTTVALAVSKVKGKNDSNNT